MSRLFAGLIGIAVAAGVAGVLVWSTQGVTVGQDPGEPGQQSWEVMTAEIPQDAQGEATTAQLSEPTVDGVVDATGGCSGDAPGTANPAAVYCYELGYEHQIVDTDEGQRGVCLFSDGSRCDAWRFLEGKCGQSYSYCATQGYDIITKTDGRNPFSREYSVCVLGQEEIGPVTELMGLAEMADRGPIPVDESPSPAEEGPPAVGQPSSFDWRNHSGQNWMTSVKDQNPCGGCWAFSAVGITEAVYNIGWNDPDLDHDLSEQQLISNNSPCCGSCGDCDGGWSDVALAYITDPGIADEACFPFTATTAPCALCPDWTSRVVTIADTGSVPTSPATIKQYLIDKGPLSVYVQILEPGDYWDGDIYKCAQPVQPNHAVVLVGYNDAGGYWIAKNSWGTGFESEGYYKVGYGECFIEDYVYYAVPQPKPGDYRLTMQVSPPGSGSTDPPVGDHWYDSGTTVGVCADPNPDWRFDGWSGDCSGLSLCTSVYMDSHKICTANFCHEGCTCHPSSDTPMAIPDLATISSIINVPDSLPIDDVNVTLNITHPWDADLDVYLESPAGTSVELFTDVGGAGQNFTDTTLDDECATPITGGTAPFTGCYQPEGMLSDFDTENSAGDWTLWVTDDEYLLDGTLESWWLEVCSGVPLEEADVKVLDFWTDPAVVYVNVSETVVVNAGELKHNNGPSSATAWASWTIDNPPEVNVRWLAQPGDECTLDGVLVPCDDPGDINDLHFEVPLPVSVSTEVFRGFELHCKEVGDFVLTLGNEEWPIGLIDPDPTNNYLETQLTVHCHPPTDTVVRIAGPTRHWTVAEGSQAVVPLDALEVDPGVCTVTVDVDYDDAVVLATACLPDPDGHFGTALCNTAISGTVSLTFVETMAPVSGDFRLADITFDAVGSSGDISPLDVTIHQFADCGGAELPVTDEDGDIEIGVLGDVDCDGDWDSVDAMFILQYVVHLREAAYQCPLPQPDPLPYLDLRGCDTQQDGDCDAVDAMFILQCVVHIPNPFCPGEG